MEGIEVDYSICIGTTSVFIAIIRNNYEIVQWALKKIFDNAKKYNKQFTIYHKYAKDLENSVEDDIKNLKDN